MQFNICSVVCGCVLQRGHMGLDVGELGGEWVGESEGWEE